MENDIKNLVIAVIGDKGGIGKTLIAYNLIYRILQDEPSSPRSYRLLTRHEFGAVALTTSRARWVAKAGLVRALRMPACAASARLGALVVAAIDGNFLCVGHYVLSSAARILALCCISQSEHKKEYPGGASSTTSRANPIACLTP